MMDSVVNRINGMLFSLPTFAQHRTVRASFFPLFPINAHPTPTCNHSNTTRRSPNWIQPL
ncbi:hypothetical protein K435DRAFT_781706 [Dendrothele bispora CBS 962.96]|uniref:Uncharacterized protein n=1 Tax=Dendrothele bispora (strain CBS 962.96) TaxID=1314807 RepID=A0A4S8LJD6_DENBC|nr:hypothetical protein K435DRAFT_781706 [Dendrothele bispora CBS 962.96]